MPHLISVTLRDTQVYNTYKKVPRGKRSQIVEEALREHFELNPPESKTSRKKRISTFRRIKAKGV